MCVCPAVKLNKKWMKILEKNKKLVLHRTAWTPYNLTEIILTRTDSCGIVRFTAGDPGHSLICEKWVFVQK